MNTAETVYQRFKESTGVCTDTRKIKPNTVFFALKGAHFNGNKFAQNALDSGCSHVVIDEAEYHRPDDSRFILVEDALQSLQDTAHRYRKDMGFTVLGITGSNGKTTTKELIYKVLSKKYSVHATPGNFNNHIGLPLTILGAKPNHEVLVLEMGDNQPGDIRELCEISDPDYGIITNIGKDHIEGFGDFEGNIQSKNELFEYLQEHHKTAVYSTTEDTVKKLALRVDNRIEYGKGTETELLMTSSDPFIHYKVNHTNKEYKTKLIGTYNFANISTAYSIGKILNVEENLIHEALCNYVLDDNRSQWIKSKKGNEIILDAYNANPSSVLPAIENLSGMNTELPKVVLLGDMLELGTISKEEHQKVVEVLKQNNFETVILIGAEFARTENHSFKQFTSVDEALKHVEALDLRSKTVLIKGSRSLKMERFLDVL